MKKDEHKQLLDDFDTEHLMKLMAIEAKKSHDGHFAVFSFTTDYKAAFGTPDLMTPSGAHDQLDKMPGFRTLKEALINALVEGKTFDDFNSGTGENSGIA